MSLTVYEVLENVEFNLNGGGAFSRKLALKQLQNALRQLEENPDIDAVFEEKEGE